MNQKQRNRLQEAFDILEEVYQEEDEKLGNMEENFSGTERYERMEEVRDSLDSIKSDLEEVMN